jgi:hypothetical protein
MYRDDFTHLDEHDRAVGAIAIAEGLIADCTNAVARMSGPDKPERWRAARLLHEAYPEIWRQLDGARRVLANRGANTIGYDELRRQVGGSTVPVLPVHDDPHTDAPTIDPAALDDARRAIDELRLAVPGADWQGIEQRTQGLVRETIFVARGQRIAVAGVLVAFFLAVAAWTSASVPDEQQDPQEDMRRELVGAVEERRARIAELGALIGQSCDRIRVHELMQLWVMDGQWQLARAFADYYEMHCGEDVVVRGWANAPRPPSARD